MKTRCASDFAGLDEKKNLPAGATTLAKLRKIELRKRAGEAPGSESVFARSNWS